MQPLYNIYYAGEILEGQAPEAVRERLGKLFKADDATLDKLFSGREQLLKRDCDKATAIKYQQAMEKAGARPVIKAVQQAAEATSAADRIASLAAAPDLEEYKGGDQTPTAAVPATSAREPGDESGLQLDAPQSDVLRPEERAKPVVANIDTSALKAEEVGNRLSQEPPPPPAAPDTSHLSMGEVGEEIPTLPPQAQPLDPDTSGLDLSPEGTDFSDCARPEAPPPDLDLSSIDMAPAGSDVVEEKYRKKSTARAPDTEHIKLEE